MTTLGIILAFVGGIICFVCYIMAIVKAFKAGETLWGVLSLLIPPFCGLIYLFIRGHKKLGLIYVAGCVLYAVGYGMFIPAIISAAQEGIQAMPEIQPAPLPQ